MHTERLLKHSFEQEVERRERKNRQLYDWQAHKEDNQFEDAARAAAIAEARKKEAIRNRHSESLLQVLF
jgi:hypothetical protein